MLMAQTLNNIISSAESRKKESLLRRWAHYECLKDKLLTLDLTPKEYQQAVRKIACVLRL